MLLNNGVRIGGGPHRTMGGAQVHAIASGRYGLSGMIRNFAMGEATRDGAAAKSALPMGYLPPYSWMLPNKSGGLAARRRLVGEGSSAANLAGGKNGAASIAGAGDVTNAALGLILSAVAALSGAGAITAAVRGRLGAAASLAGAGDLDGALGAIAGAIAALSGSGTVSGAVPKGPASMAASIVVTGTALNSANVGASVWSHLIESGYSAEQILRLLAAVAGGKVSGGPGSPVFRDIGDTKDRVTGTADSSGNRTAATYDLT